GRPYSFEGQPDGHRPLADRRGDPLGRAAADVTHRVDARPARLQHRARPAGPVRRGAGWRGVRPGPDEAVLVEVDEVTEPAGARGHADEDEQGPRGERAPLAGLAVLDRDRFQRLVAEQLAHL